MIFLCSILIKQLQNVQDSMENDFIEGASAPKVLTIRPTIVNDFRGRGRGRGRGKISWGGGAGLETLDPVRRSTQCIQSLRLEDPSDESGAVVMSDIMDFVLSQQVTVH